MGYFKSIFVFIESAKASLVWFMTPWVLSWVLFDICTLACRKVLEFNSLRTHVLTHHESISSYYLYMTTYNRPFLNIILKISPLHKECDSL